MNECSQHKDDQGFQIEQKSNQAQTYWNAELFQVAVLSPVTGSLYSAVPGEYVKAALYNF